MFYMILNVREKLNWSLRLSNMCCAPLVSCEGYSCFLSSSTFCLVSFLSGSLSPRDATACTLTLCSFEVNWSLTANLSSIPEQRYTNIPTNNSLEHMSACNENEYPRLPIMFPLPYLSTSLPRHWHMYIHVLGVVAFALPFTSLFTHAYICRCKHTF